MNVLDLFSGIGGFSLGLERCGMRTVAFCEREPYPRAVLAARWPGVPCYPDIRTLTAQQLATDGVVRPDLITGGFPCQDISSAGRGAGLDGERSRLWFEMLRVIDEVRPRWIVAENSPSLRGRGGDRVLSGLEALGYACWPVVVGAVHAGAWHRRQRVWIVAHAGEGGQREGQQHLCSGQPHAKGVCGRHAADADRVREHEPALRGEEQRLRLADGASRTAADLGGDGRPTRPIEICAGWSPIDRGGSGAPDAALAGLEVEQPGPPSNELAAAFGGAAHAHQFDAHNTGLRAGAILRQRPASPELRDRERCAGAAQPDLVRVVHGLSAGMDGPARLEEVPIAWPFDEEPPIPRTARDVPNRVDRISALGNAVVPDVVAMIGRAILSVDAHLGRVA